jgi:hypothetical protein
LVIEVSFESEPGASRALEEPRRKADVTTIEPENATGWGKEFETET